MSLENIHVQYIDFGRLHPESERNSLPGEERNRSQHLFLLQFKIASYVTVDCRVVTVVEVPKY